MATTAYNVIKIQVTVKAPIEHTWKCWVSPGDIMKWNFASEDWHTTKSENDLKVGGKFLSRMEAKDGSFGFNFEGIYDMVDKYHTIEYTLLDARKVRVTFHEINGQTLVVEEFEAESENPVEMQKNGWQAILNNFKLHTESVFT